MCPVAFLHPQYPSPLTAAHRPLPPLSPVSQPRLAALVALLAITPGSLFSQTWDGEGNNGNWTNGANWNTNNAPTAGAHVTFDGTTRTSVNIPSTVSPASLTFAGGAGAFVLSGNGINLGSGGLANNSPLTQTIGNQVTLAANQTWTLASGNLALAGYLGAAGYNLTLAGSGNVTFGGQVNGAGTLVTTGAGDRTFNAYVSATRLEILGDGAVTFATAINAGSGGIAINGAGDVVFNGINSGGSLSIAGTGDRTFNGSSLSVSTISVTGGDQVVFNTQISNSVYTQSGGAVTFSGTGTNSFSSFNVTGGSLHLDKTGGIAVNTGQINVSNATLTFGENNQFNESWTDITLGDGAILQLGNTTQTIDNLVISGDSVIDFGTGGATFDIDNLTLSGDSTLTILNWADDLDRFYASVTPGSSNLAKIIFDGYGEATWSSGSGGVIFPSAPVPEPAATGLLVVGFLSAYSLLRRAPRPAAPARPSRSPVSRPIPA